MGTKIQNLAITKIIDGDTIYVDLNSKEEKIRLTNIDTEESKGGGSKPVTKLGKETAEFTRNYFTENEKFSNVEIEFDTDDPLEVCLFKHRDNFGRLLCYVFKNGENYNTKLIKEGMSPYFEKYGRSRVYHQESMMAEREAQSNNKGIWDPIRTSEGDTRGNYSILISWWNLRALIIEDYRKAGLDRGVLSVRLDYEKIKDAATNHKTITVFCDMQNGFKKTSGNGFAADAGSPKHRFSLWIPNTESDETLKIINLLNNRYVNENKRNYVYISGEATLYKDDPQIIITGINQISDFP